jgi:glycosyltransferase involved in cell wall biosynthesis
MTKIPRLSVVIPAYRRPHDLPLAVASALDASSDGDVEVIVVPNGNDDSWRDAASKLVGDSRVSWHPISAAQANKARNHGMSLARGKFLRFLDDDDYFLPNAQIQLDLIEQSNADICSGAVEARDQSGHVRAMPQRDAEDLVVAMVSPNRVCLPCAHVFLRSAISNKRWDESLSSEQDTEWMLRLCAEREWEWIPTRDAVAVWRTHSGPRTSGEITDIDRARRTVDLLLRTLADLRGRNALFDRRAESISEALWDFAHSHFFRDFRFGQTTANTAMQLIPGSRPPDAIFKCWPISKLNPLLVEYLMIPKRRWNERRRGK